MTAPMNQFMTDEYVLAYHGPLLYEARVSLVLISDLSARTDVVDAEVCADA